MKTQELRLLETQETKMSTLQQLLVEGEESGMADYDLDSLINELDREEKRREEKRREEKRKNEIRDGYRKFPQGSHVIFLSTNW